MTTPAPDPFETLFERGVTDGLPVVPPTRERVEAMVAGSGREADELIALVPPNFGRATVEKIAINAVMAGCRPDYLPVVIAGVEAMSEDAFDLHGVSATTNFHSPLFIVNGPARAALDINCGRGAFGPGWRANATIGRALRLIVANVGGASARTMSMSTMGHPGRYTYCMGENEEESPWDSLAVISNHRSTHHGDTLVVLSPEHAKMIAGEGWGKAEMRQFLWERLRTRVRDLIPGVDGGEGLPARVLAKFPYPESDDTLIPKFREPGNLKFLVAGGTAGRFSAVIPGWTFPKMSRLVIKAVHMP